MQGLLVSPAWAFAPIEAVRSVPDAGQGEERGLGIDLQPPRSVFSTVA
jgi:hypothetical protein